MAAVRIAVFCPSFGQVGGIETKARVLIDAFRSRGHTVTVLARGEPSAPSNEADVPLVRLPYHQLPRRGRHVARQLRFARSLPGTVAALRRAVLDGRADVVLTLAVSSYAPYAAGLAGAAPVVLSLEAGGPDLDRHPWALRWALRRAARVIAVATSLARTVVRLAPDVAPRVTVVPNGVDPARFAEGPRFAHARPYVLAVARLSHEKGVDVLLDAMTRVPDVDLVVAGDGPERATLLARRDALGLAGRAHFLGAVAVDDVPALYRGALAVACPSRWEGLPLVCLEAMASGRAVVASAVDGVPDVVVDGETGMLVPPEDPPALAAALSALVSDPSRRERLGTHGAALVRERFTWTSVVDRYLVALEGAVAG